MWNGPPLRLAQMQGLDFGFVMSQSGFHSEGRYEGEGSVVQWL